VQRPFEFQFRKRLKQKLVHQVELIGALGNKAEVNRVFQPFPLKNRSFI